jgi:tRNA dimethylallyltransferase
VTKFGVEVIAIFGPTGSGKTEVAELLASRIGTEIVSADALQVYRGLEVITNQPHRPTRLVAIQDVSDEMSVGRYARLAHDAIDELVDRNGVAIVVGGTGLYLRAALVDMAIPPAPVPARARWERPATPIPTLPTRRSWSETRARLNVHATTVGVVRRRAGRRKVSPPAADRLWSEEMRRSASSSASTPGWTS